MNDYYVYIDPRNFLKYSHNPLDLVEPSVNNKFIY